ncbi:MAG TPA: hypothetical protein VFB58_00780 [Chloroflexota bacterium]|nr:hypothetical protein [Chloroflexota bacterium]
MNRQRLLVSLITIVTVVAAVLGILVSPPDVVAYEIAGTSFALVGAFIIFQYPMQPIAWILAAIGPSWEISITAQYIGAYVHRHHLPGLAPLASLSIWLYMVNLLLFFWLTMLFPSGTLGRRWRPVFWAGTAGIVVTCLIQMVTPGPSNVPHVANPLGIVRVPDAVSAVPGVLAIGALPASVLYALLRLRRTYGIERQQIKLFVYGTSLALTLTTIAIFSGWNGPLGTLGSIALSLLPLTIGAAILRYRLYDIDLIINRTLVYGSLTLSLGALYIGGVIGLEALLRTVTGQSSDLAVAVVTLAIAALFNPWRGRLQTFIDHRFYRRKYDAARILSAFQAALRDEVNLDHLQEEMLAVIVQTMQPAALALWLPREER